MLSSRSVTLFVQKLSEFRLARGMAQRMARAGQRMHELSRRLSGSGRAAGTYSTEPLGAKLLRNSWYDIFISSSATWKPYRERRGEKAAAAVGQRQCVPSARELNGRTRSETYSKQVSE